MHKDVKLTPAILHKLLKSDPVAGKLFWRKRTPDMFSSKKYSAKQACAIWNGRYPMTEALAIIGSTGYKKGGILGKYYQAHRVIWAMHYGEWPKDQIDHINRNRLDNRISNLRVVTNRGNGRNRSMDSRNTSGFNGVSRIKVNGKWTARIAVKGKLIHLGCFTKKSDAIRARAIANVKYGYANGHGEKPIKPIA